MTHLSFIIAVEMLSVLFLVSAPCQVVANPIVPPDNTFASPAGLERIGANVTALSASFSDTNSPPVSSFLVTFRLREPDNASLIVLAENAGNGTSGVTITDQGGGNYAASLNWDAPDDQALGFYDLYFHVTDGIDTSYDFYSNNLDELEVYDAVSNNGPTLAAGNTAVIPATISRIGSDFAMIKAAFSDADIPGSGAFTITIKVRDQLQVEYTIVNAAKHEQQGLRIRHGGGPDYEASVLWDPPDEQPIGLYDLFFEVVDNEAEVAIDGYSNNPDEFTLTTLTAPGDGHLLRRSNSADACGGPNSACHNLNNHESQDCRVCHTPHGTTNIYMIRDTIQTPNSGPWEVILKTLGIGDPYNDPDPTPGDPTSGVMADDADGVFTGVCEVCHTSTSHHRNDGSQPQPNHHNAENCTECHSHSDGFTRGESSGGLACSCHNSIFTAMDSTSTSYHHVLANDDPDYSPGISGMYSIKNCLTCHVDHDIFRPDMNVGIGERGKNLRVDYATDPVQGDNSVLANSDYSASGLGGLCLSCHSGPSCDGCHSAHRQPLQLSSSSFQHTFIPKAAYDAATSAHNYNVPVTFSSDGSAFQANCSKCHNDNMSKSYQNSGFQTSMHSSDFTKLLDTNGIASPTDPLEEKFCFKCHSTTSNPFAGSNLDFFAVKGMGVGALGIETAFSESFTHPVTGYSGVHAPGEDATTMTRHVECEDCHNPHAATADRPPSPALSGALLGVSGIDTAGNPIDPVTNSYQICFKCHGDNPGATPQITRVNNSMNTRLEFHADADAYHPVTDTGKNSNVPSLILPLTEKSIIACESCHNKSAGSSEGPHGSQFSPVLKLRYESADNTPESAGAYALCYSCHNRSSILADDSFKKHDKHIRGADAPCSVCHDPHGVNGPLVGDGTNLINFDTDICSPANGRLEFIDDGLFAGTCYVLCHGKNHNPKSY